MIKRAWVLFALLLGLAFTLRVNQFENRAPFDWDQNRDYSEVVNISHGKTVVLGPVARGVGGFSLGSLYYYLLYPAYILMQGSLSALPFTSLTLDALVSGLIFLMFHKRMGQSRALGVAIIWSISWLLIDTSRISWNVALVPLWSLLTLYAIVQLIEKRGAKYFYSLALLTGLSTHIHVAAIPVIPLLLMCFFKSWRFSLKTWITGICLAIIPTIPLISYDITHHFENAHRVKDLFVAQSTSHISLASMVNMAFIKLGKVVSGIWFAKFANNQILGIVMLLLSFWAVKRSEAYLKVSGLMVIVATLLIVAFRDYSFPEYYFASAYLASIIIIVSSLSELSNKFVLSKAIYWVLLATVVWFNARAYTVSPTESSLAFKEQIIHSLKKYESLRDITYNFDPGRDGGFRYLVEREGIVFNPQSKQRIIISDKIESPLYIEGELAADQLKLGKIKTALYIVQ